MTDVLLQVKNLSVSFGDAEVVSGVSFSVRRGETLALVGESGCGKSSASAAITRLLPPGGRMTAEGVVFRSSKYGTADLAVLPMRKLRQYRGGGIAYIFQEPSVSLNPVMTVREQIAEVIRLHRREVTDVDREIIGLLEQVGIPDAPARLRVYPHELSGGMQQRVMIAMALAGDPELLVADEPTTALDVTVQAQILKLLDELRRRRNMAILLISHNLGVVGELSDRIAVMYAGRIVESGPVRSIIRSPRHPYTRALLAAVPRLGGTRDRLQTIPGFVPPPSAYPAGCRFADRCPLRMPECAGAPPPMISVGEEHLCGCFAAEKESAE